MSIFDKISGRFGDLLDEVRIPEDLHRTHEEAAAALTRGDGAKALSLLQPTLTHYPGVYRTHALMARAWRATGQLRAASDAVDQAISLRDLASLRLMAGELSIEQRRYRDAQKHLQRGVALPDAAPLSLEFARLLAQVYIAEGMPERAERELRRCLKADPADTEAAASLAELLLPGQPRAAREVLEAADPKASRARTLLLLARIHQLAAQLDDARRLSEQAHEQLQSFESGVLLAQVTLAQGDVDRADVVLAELHAKGDEAVATHASLKGAIARAKEDWAESRSQFAHVLALRPNDAAALLGVGQAELALGNVDVANGFFLQAMHTPLRAGALSGMGRALVARGDRAGARHYLEEALRESNEPALASQVHLDLAQIVTDPAEVLGHLLDAQALGVDVGARIAAATDALRPNLEVGAVSDPSGLEALVARVLEWASKDARLVEFLTPLQAQLQKLNAPLSVAIVGEFNAGKSTLLNAILEEDLLPVGVLPTTAHTGIVRFGPRRAARIHWTDRAPEEVEFAVAARAMKDNAAEVRKVDFVFPHPVLRAIEFWDTPGFNALEERHEEVAAQALTSAEAILWVMDANQVLSATEFDRIDHVRNGAERLIVVINKIDRLGRGAQAQIDELIEYVEDNIGAKIAGVFAVSAQQAVEKRGDEPQNFRDFRAYLDEHVMQRAGRIKVLEVRDQLFRTLLTISAYGQGRVASLQGMARTLEDTRTWVLGDATRANGKLVEAQRRGVEDAVANLLTELEHEIAAGMRPTGQIISRPQLATEDAQGILHLMVRRIRRDLDGLFAMAEAQLDAQEAELARRLERLTKALPTVDSRAVHRGIEGFFDQLRAMRALLRERFVERALSVVESRVEAVGTEVFLGLDADKAMWRPSVRKLLPDLSAHVASVLVAGLDDWAHQVLRLTSRLEREVELLKLESQARYDVETLLAALDETPADADDPSIDTDSDV